MIDFINKSQENTMIYLYIKTHNVTGLKYLGKTTQDPYKYKGSGKRWLNHIKKHGNNVTTEIVGQFDTIEELRSISISLSEKYNIVHSNEWANLRPESGDGGNTSQYIDYSQLNRGKGQTYEQRYGKQKASELKQLRSENLIKKRKGKTYEQIFGVEKAKELKKIRSQHQAKIRIGKTLSQETKNKIRQKSIGRIQSRCSCIICKSEVSINNLTNHIKKHY